MTDFNLNIPKPCNKSWNAMTPNNAGRFCDFCDKTVVDFTSMTKEEIKIYFIEHTKQKTCGHFKVEQTTYVPPKHHQLLINLYNKAETNLSTRFFKTPFLLFIGMLMAMAGCKSEVSGERVAVSNDTLLNQLDTTTNKNCSSIMGKTAITKLPKDTIQHQKGKVDLLIDGEVIEESK
jgi:hypothetical protein